DIMQDVWYQLSNQPSPEEIDSMSGWLHRVARNKITDKYRKKKENSLDDFSYEDDEGLSIADFFLADDNNPGTKELQQIFWETLIEALDELPQNQREVFVLNEFEDKTLQQIADMQHENLKTIISRKRYAVLHLRKRLEDLYNEFMNY
ncbi:MAG TPA: RNA polymerase sigma factor, partial [Parafilimonas sp.]